MSVEPLERDGGRREWRVRWRENGKNRSRVLGKKRDAEAFDAEIKRQKRLGVLAQMDQGQQSLSDFAAEWWARYAVPNLSERTRQRYAGCWDRHVLPYLGGHQLRSLSTDVLVAWAQALRESGTGPQAIRKSMVLLQGMLQRAVEWERIPTNPMKLVPKPSVKPARQAQVLTAEQVTQLLEWAPIPRDRFIVGLLAYAGLRPGELRALAWEDIRDGRIYVDKAADMRGDLKDTKTHRSRSVTIDDRLQAVIGPYADTRADRAENLRGPVLGTVWADWQWVYWTKSVWNPLRERLGVDAVPYDLRHTYVTTLIYQGANLIEIARSAGHTPTTMLGWYAHAMDEAA